MTEANLETIWQGSFHPDDDVRAANQLREAFLAQRRDHLAAVLEQCRMLATRGIIQVPEQIFALTERLSTSSPLLVDDPVFAIWLRFFYRAWGKGQQTDAIYHAKQLESVLADVERRLTGDAQAYVPETSIAVEASAMHEYIQQATPPTYDFSQLPKEAEHHQMIGHSLRMQADLLGYAMRNINATWPAMHDQVTEYVRIFGYLPDATFRSCSAARYTGIVYLGNMDESILDIEESIVHEVGHQVLYRVGELTRITHPDAPITDSYTLPWSGSRRDLFGYVHAYYIYALLIKYFWRRAEQTPRDALECQQRAGFILAGSLAATPELLRDRDLTPQGKAIIEQIATDLDRLRADIRAALDKQTMGHYERAIA